MSRTLLISRLRKLEPCGVIERRDGEGGANGGRAYHLTPAGRALGPVVTQLGTWAQQWFRTKFDKHELDAGVLMWDIKCTLDPNAFSGTRIALQFVFSDAPPNARNWWLVHQDGELDLRPVNPGVEVGLVIRTTLAMLTRIWMGDVPLKAATREGRLKILGSSHLRSSFERCFCLSPYACVPDARENCVA
jgi:hypothetical protein